ncbi:hypothetical protein [Mucilaginibacter sp.]
MINNRKIAVVSEYYHGNYNELKEHIIASGIKYIGQEEVDIVGNIKDIFS